MLKSFAVYVNDVHLYMLCMTYIPRQYSQPLFLICNTYINMKASSKGNHKRAMQNVNRSSIVLVKDETMEILQVLLCKILTSP